MFPCLYRYYYEIATLTIVAGGVPYVLAFEPVKSESNWEVDGESQPRAEVVDKLLSNACEHVDIDLVIADREFDANSIEHVIANEHGLDYLLPKKLDSDDAKEWYADAEQDEDVVARAMTEVSLEVDSRTPYVDPSDDTVGTDENPNESHKQTIAFVPANKDSWEIVQAEETNEPLAAFVTNRDVGPLVAMELVEQYDNRWEIENEYRMILPFLPSIASTDPRMRLFAFAFGIMLYNVWRAVDHAAKVLVAERFDQSLSELLDGDPVLPMSDLVTTAALFFVFEIS